MRKACLFCEFQLKYCNICCIENKKFAEFQIYWYSIFKILFQTKIYYIYLEGYSACIVKNIPFEYIFNVRAFLHCLPSSWIQCNYAYIASVSLFFCPLGVQWLSLVPAIERKTRNSEHKSKTPLVIVQVKYWFFALNSCFMLTTELVPCC